MAIRTLTRLYDHHEDAVSTVQALEAAGMGHDEISLIGGNEAGTYGTAAPAGGTATTHGGEGAGAGATIGTLLGGGAGLLAGIGALAIPGLGPVVAAGWLVAAITGAGVGAAALGLVGALVDSGVSHEDAEVYAEGVRRGGFLVTARVDDSRVAEAQHILSSRGVDVAARRREYQAAGWTGYQADAARPLAGTTVDPAR